MHVPSSHGVASVAGAVTVTVTVTVGPGVGDGRTVFVTVGTGCGRAATIFRGSVTVTRGSGRVITVTLTILSGPGTRFVTVARGRGCTGFSSDGTLSGDVHTTPGFVTGLETSEAPIIAMPTSAETPSMTGITGWFFRAVPCDPIYPSFSDMKAPGRR